MEEIKPVVTEIYGVESRDESKIIAFLDFCCKVKSSWFSTESSSRLAELSIWALMEEFKPGPNEIYEFENCDKPIMNTVFWKFCIFRILMPRSKPLLLH